MGSINKINQELPPGATPLTAEELEGLLPKYITTRRELDDAEFKNISDASKIYLLSRKKIQFILSNLYKIHKEMFGNVWAWAGKKRKTNKNIGVDKAQIDMEMKKFIGGMHLTPVTTIYCISYFRPSADNRLGGHRINCHRLLDEAVE